MTLKYLVVGTGRDGTVTVTHLLKSIFELNGQQAAAAHEWLARDCYEAYCESRESANAAPLDSLREAIASCPYTAIVGNGYASVLGIFREQFPDLALVHLKRQDRHGTIASLMKNSKLFPETFLYYGAKSGTMRRVAAFHEGDMSRQAWDSLDLYNRFEWLYDYTHRTIQHEKPYFKRHLDLITEELSDLSTMKALAQFVAGDCATTPGSVWLNRHSYISVDDFSERTRPLAQWLFGSLAASDIERDPIYLSEYVTNKFIALTGYQITGFIKEVAPTCEFTREEIDKSLIRFEELLKVRLREIELLKQDLVATQRFQPGTGTRSATIGV